MSSRNSDHVCCVTGANGFLASHIVKQLLEEGYRVRGTVRNKVPHVDGGFVFFSPFAVFLLVRLTVLFTQSDLRKTGHLLALPHAAERLELFNADLTVVGSFDAAFDGCQTVLHVAMPVVMASKNPMRDIVDPALKGVANVVESVRRNVKSIRKVIYTSSLETIGDVARARLGETFTENDWNESADMSSPYSFAKVAAEKAVVEAFSEAKELRRVRLIRLLPGWISGPLLNGNAAPPVSLEPFRALGSGEYPFAPRLNVQVVDVRDCARAHVLAVAEPISHSNHRIAVTSDVIISMKELCDISRRMYPSIPWASIVMPDIFLYVATLWDARLSYGFLRDNLGIVYRVSNEQSVSVLNMRYRPVEDTLRDSVASLLEHDLLPRKYSRINFMIMGILVVLLLVYFLVRTLQ